VFAFTPATVVVGQSSWVPMHAGGASYRHRYGDGFADEDDYLRGDARRDQTNAVFSIILRPHQSRHWPASSSGRAHVSLRGIRHGQHGPAYVKLEGIVLNVINGNNDPRLIGHADWYRSKRQKIYQQIERLSVMGDAVAIDYLTQSLIDIHKEYNRFRASKKQLNDVERTLRNDELLDPFTDIIAAHFSSDSRKLCEELIKLNKQKPLGYIKQVFSPELSGKLQGAMRRGSAAKRRVAAMFRRMSTQSQLFSEKIGRGGGYAVNNALVNAKLELLMEAAVHCGNNLTFITYAPVEAVHKHPRLASSAGDGREGHAASSLRDLIFLRVGEPGKSKPSKAAHAQRVARSTAMRRLYRQHALEIKQRRAGSLKPAEVSELHVLYERKGSATALLNGFLVSQMYALFDYARIRSPRTAEPDFGTAALLLAGDCVSILMKETSNGVRTNSVKTLIRTMELDLYLTFLAFPQLTRGRWERPAGGGNRQPSAEFTAGVIYPFMDLVLNDWLLAADDPARDSIKQCIMRLFLSHLQSAPTIRVRDVLHKSDQLSSVEDDDEEMAVAVQMDAAADTRRRRVDGAVPQESGQGQELDDEQNQENQEGQEGESSSAVVSMSASQVGVFAPGQLVDGEHPMVPPGMVCN
jgi:hypothetical protein